ncbi:MAG: DMT family transporter [Sphingomonadales bacterium]
MERHRSLDAFAVSVMVVLCALWGSTQGILKMTAAEVHPVLQVGLRCAIASVLIVVWTAARRERLALRDGTLAPGLAAGAVFTAEFLIIGFAIDFTTASHMSVFLYTAPIFTALGLHLRVPEERFGAAQWAGVALAFGGVFVIFAAEFASGRPYDPLQLLGDAMAILGGAMWAATTVIIKSTRLAEASPAKVTLYQLAVAGVVLIALTPWLPSNNSFQLSGFAWASVLWQASIIAFASYMVWFWLMRTYSASRLSIASFLTPIFGVAFGVLVLDEPLTANFVAGAVLILTGIAVVNGAFSRRLRRA